MTKTETMMSVHGVVPGKVCVGDKDVSNVSIFSCNKKIFVTR